MLRLLGNTSLTPRATPTGGGSVTVVGRGADPPTIASLQAGVVWAEAARERVLILPEEGEWEALASK